MFRREIDRCRDWRPTKEERLRGLIAKWQGRLKRSVQQFFWRMLGLDAKFREIDTDSKAMMEKQIYLQQELERHHPPMDVFAAEDEEIA